MQFMESLKLWGKSLMGARKPDGSIDWMMTGFVWFFTLLILFIVIGIPIIVANKKKKSKFNVDGIMDTQLQILIRSGLPEEQAFERSRSFLGYLTGTLRLGYPTFTFMQDPSLGNETQIVYQGGSESLFRNTTPGTLLGYAAEPGVEIDTSFLDKYTNPRFMVLLSTMMV